MGWNLKQKAQDHIVSIGLGLVVLLLLIVYRAVDSSVWDRVSEAVPKRALWALLALESIAIIGFAASLYRKSRHQHQLRIFAYGVSWAEYDGDVRALCPNCDVGLFIKRIESTYDVLQCPKCNIEIPLIADNHQRFHLFNAKEMVREFKRFRGVDIKK